MINSKFFSRLREVAALGILLFASAVYAQAAAPEAHGAFYNVVMFLLAHSLQTVTTLLLVTGFPLFFTWWGTKRAADLAAHKSTTFDDIVDKVAHFAKIAVAAADGSLIPNIAAGAAAGSVDGAKAKADASAMVASFLSPAGLAQLAAILGTPAAPATPATVSNFIDAHVEHAVDLKNNAADAAAAGGLPEPTKPA